jgi:hypothetical protein
MTTPSRKISVEVHLTLITNVWFFKFIKISDSINIKYVMPYLSDTVLAVNIYNMNNVLVWHLEVYIRRK